MTFRDDPLYQTLRARLYSPNIFVCLKVHDYEIRHSNFIAWLLHPEESHGAGDLFLRAFLKSAGLREPGPGERFAIKREERNIDLLLKSDDRVVAIENKVRAKDGDGQLRKYRERIEAECSSATFQQAFIYWTMTGEAPTDAAEAAFWQRYSHKQFADVLEAARSTVGDPKVGSYIDDYVSALRIHVLDNTEHISWAKSIYSRHRDPLEERFRDSSGLELMDRRTLEFIEQHSSFVRGNGFFAKEREYRKAFERACKRHGYRPSEQGEKQSTYFAFLPESGRAMFEDSCAGFSFRFDDDKRKLRFTFGLKPSKSPEQARLRARVADNTPLFHQLSVGIGRISDSEGHRSILRATCDFDPPRITPADLDGAIDDVFKRTVVPLVDEVSKVMRTIGLGSR